MVTDTTEQWREELGRVVRQVQGVPTQEQAEKIVRLLPLGRVEALRRALAALHSS